MFSAWAKLAVALTLSLALVAAPCRNCQPKPQPKAQQDCGHDCCPKPKPAQKACSWQPADYDAVESAKAAAISAPALMAITEATVTVAPTCAAPANHRPACDPSPPPVYLSTSNLRF